MPVPTLTVAIDDLYTTTWQNRRDGVADNVFAATPFWYWMKEKGKLKPVRGGKTIEENLAYGSNTTVGWVGRGGTVSLQDYKFLTVGIYQWAYLAASMVRFGVDDQQNSGKSKILDWVQQKIDNTEESLVETLETSLAASAPAAASGAGTSIGGLQWLVSNTQTSANNPGGIDPTVYPWWANQSTNLTGLSFATNGVNNMRSLLHKCMNNKRMDMPDIILSDQSSYEYYEDTVLSYYRTQDRKLADAGFDNQSYKGIPMVWSPSLSQAMYFLNTRFLQFVYDPARFFEMTPWKDIPDQIFDRAAQIITACCFLTNRRRVQGVIYNINTQ